LITNNELGVYCLDGLVHVQDVALLHKGAWHAIVTKYIGGQLGNTVAMFISANTSILLGILIYYKTVTMKQGK
jgi:hypothetical protein